ncbi:beta-1,4-galactosyltransferase 1-like [Sardina pilchardus]|uniref:beta-1,4-galactosyltransferase 1-like n=1 Tax=Sardina pilchardus TaxID=27697 RepID=UPI002E10DE4D
MSVWPCNLKGATCTSLFCLGAVNLTLAMIYVLFFKDGRLFATSSRPAHLAMVAPKTNMVAPTNLVAPTNVTEAEMDLCPEIPSHLVVGPLRIEFNSPVSMEFIQKENPEVEGGHWWPIDCIARQKVAIIIPFRDRESHLRYWLYYLHPILQRQLLDYRIYVINQYGETTFNRAKLMNVGYAEARKQYDYECFVFSDVDVIPMDDRNFYRCYSQPRHISVALDKFGFRLIYTGIFGGVTALSKKQFNTINGFPNKYWGWGGEDDDISYRLSFNNLSISRPDMITGRCRMIRHGPDLNNEPNPSRFDYIEKTRSTMATDGINSLEYKVIKVEKHQLYTNITVDIGKP